MCIRDRKGECPKRRLAGNAGGDEGKEEQGQKQGGGVALSLIHI